MTDGAIPIRHGVLPVLEPSRIERMGPTDPAAAPACPLCGAETVRRTSSSGPRAGIELWGCVTYPACRGTLDIGGTSRRSAVARAGADAGSGAAGHVPASGVAAAVGQSTGAQDVPGISGLQSVTAAIGPAALAARHALAGIARASAVLLQAAPRTARRAISRSADWALDMIHPTSAALAATGRNVAGASAQAEFDRHRARHRIKMRAALPTFVGLTVIGMAMGFLGLLAHGALTAALGAAAAGGVGIWAIGRLPADALAWGRGAAGERRTAEHLDELEADGYVVLHDRRVPGLRTNVDHIAIGPAGIFVVETRNLRGKLTIVGDKLFVGERTRTGAIDATLREAMAVQVCLADRLNALRSTVHPVLCVHRTAQLLLDNEVQGVRVVSGRQLARFLRRLPVLFDDATVQDLAATADTRLLPAIR